MMNELRAIIFDFDGVIADTEPLHFAALQQVLAGIDIALTEAEYYRDYLGFDDRGCFMAALQQHHRQVTPALLTELMHHKALAYLTAVKEHLAIFPGPAAPSFSAGTSYLDSMQRELKRIIAQPQALWNRVVNLILT